MRTNPSLCGRATEPRAPRQQLYVSALKSQDGFSSLLCEELAGWRYDDLPAAVVHKAKLCLIDSLGVIAGAARAAGIAELNALLGSWETMGGAATGLIGKRKYSPPSAALANGTAAHALDFDDQHDAARVHTACVLFPSLLAIAEVGRPVTGKEFLLAYVLGAELDARLGLACYNSLGKGWHPTMVFGALAASVASARLLRLKGDGLLNALGMAFHQASGSAQSMRDGVLSKRIGAGFAARAAVTAACMAAHGLTGTRRPLEGTAGLFALFERGEVRPETLIGGLGHEWRMLQYSFKPYPCCRCSHSAIELGIELHRRGIRPAAVRAVEIGLGKVNWEAVGGEYQPNRTSVVHAQFSVGYCFARALSDGRVDLRSFDSDQITDAAIGELTGRIRASIDPTIPAQSLERVRVVVTLESGEVVELAKEAVKGSPCHPLTEQEIVDKFRACHSYGYGDAATSPDELVDTLISLEREADAAAAIVSTFPEPR